MILHPIMEKLGKDTREISIRLLFDNIRQNLITEFRFQDNQRKVVCHGDGERAWFGQGNDRKLIQCNPNI